MLRIGIVDFDTSHAIEFTRRFNHVGVDRDECVDGARVVVGCPGESEMAPERIPGFTEEVKECGVELVEKPTDMLGRIDAVLIHSLCGRPHLERVRPFLEARLPAFVDKPFACEYRDAVEMIELAEKHGVALMSASALRFARELEAFHVKRSLFGEVHGALAYGPAKRAEGNPGLLHYGIHAATVLFSLMGPGCESVTNACEDGSEVVTGRWSDGRLGTLRGSRAGAAAYGFVAFCENAVVPQTLSTRYVYRNICRSIVETFGSGQPTVPHEENLEILRFILAARMSEHAGGQRVFLSAVE